MKTRQEKEIPLTLESIDGYLEYLRSAGRVQGTLDSYRRKIGRLYQALPEEDKSIRRDTLPWWREKLAEEGGFPGRYQPVYWWSRLRTGGWRRSSCWSGGRSGKNSHLPGHDLP